MLEANGCRISDNGFVVVRDMASRLAALRLMAPEPDAND